MTKNIIPQPATATPILRAQTVRQNSASPSVPVGPQRAGCQPTISLDKVAGDVRQIEITCGCGEKIVLELHYS